MLVLYLSDESRNFRELWLCQNKRWELIVWELSAEDSKRGGSWSREPLYYHTISVIRASEQCEHLTGHWQLQVLPLLICYQSRPRTRPPLLLKDPIVSWGFVDAPIEPTTVLDFSVIFLCREQFPANLIWLSIDYDCAPVNTAMLTGICSRCDLHKLVIIISKSNEPPTFWMKL